MSQNTYTKPYISPQPLFERIRLDRFVGRAWLLEEVDHFINHNDRGYFIVEAEIGLGKTAFIAHLVQQRAYIHLFVQQAPGLDNLADGLRSLASQIGRIWNLQHVHTTEFDDDVLPGISVRPDFLHRLLAVAAYQRDQIQPDAPIVLVIDGLEQAGTFPGQNVMGLPHVLPRGVYILVSQRVTQHAPSDTSNDGVPNKHIELQTDCPTHLFCLKADDARNIADVQKYLEQVTSQDPIASMIQTHGMSPEHVQTTLREKSQGNWAYLFAVVEEIHKRAEDIRQTLPSWLESLPTGLCAWYAAYWQRWRDRDQAAWHNLLLPLLCTLCALQESMPLDLLHGLAGIDEPKKGLVPFVSVKADKATKEHIRSLLDEEWNLFINVTVGDERMYCMCDTNFCHFPYWCVDSQTIREAHQPLVEELVLAIRQAHNRIAERYINAWGEIVHTLPWLTDPNLRDLDNGYGMRHIIFHLREAGRNDDVHSFMRMERVTRAYAYDSPSDMFEWLGRFLRGEKKPPSHYTPVWYAAREQQGDLAGFLNDVAQAWQVTDDIAIQIQYALIRASINSLSLTLPLPLLSALLSENVWLPAQGFEYIREIPDEEQRAMALAVVAPYVYDEEEGGEINTDTPRHVQGTTHLSGKSVLAVARAIGDEQARMQALAKIAAGCPVSLLDEIVASAQAMTHPVWRIKTLVRVIPHLPEHARVPIVKDVLDTVHTIWHAHVRGEVLVALAPYLSYDQQRQALDRAQEIVDTDWRIKTLIGLSRVLSKPLLREAMHMWEVWSKHWRAKVLITLADRIEEFSSMEKALDIANHIEHEEDQAQALASLAPHLPTSLIHEALHSAQAIANDAARATALKGLFPHLPNILLRVARDNVRTMQNNYARVHALIAFIPSLPQNEHRDIAHEILSQARALQPRESREQALIALALQLAELGYIEHVIEAVQQEKDRLTQTRMLVYLAPYLPEHLLQTVLEKIHLIRNANQRFNMLTLLAPHLPATLLLQALDAARTIGDCNHQARTLIAFTAHVPESLLPHVLEAVRMVGNEQDRAELLVELCPHLPELLQREALHIARAIETEEHRSSALGGIAAFIPESQARTLVDAVLSMAHVHEKANALRALAPHIPKSLVQDVFEKARQIEHEQERAMVLRSIIPRLHEITHGKPHPMLQKAMREAHTMKGYTNRAIVLSTLIPVLANHGLHCQALEEAWTIGDTDMRATTLVQLAPYLSEMQIKKVLSAVHTMQQPDMRARALIDIRPYLPTEDQPYIIDEVLYAARAAKWQGDAAIPTIVPKFPEPEVPEKVFDSVRYVDSRVERVQLLIALLPFLPEHMQERARYDAFTAACDIHTGEHRAEALASLAPHLSERLGREALKEARALEREEWRRQVLKKVLPLLSTSLQQEVVHEMLTTLRNAGQPREDNHARVYVQDRVLLSTYSAASQQQEILAEALNRARDIADTTERAQAFHTLAPHLATLPVDVLYLLWCETLHVLARRTRRDMLSDIRALAPVMVALRDETVLADVSEVIMQVGLWFT